MPRRKKVLQHSVLGIDRPENILAIDFSITSPGLCLYRFHGDSYQVYTKKFLKTNFPHLKDRCESILAWILECYTPKKYDEIWMEGVSYNSKSSSFVQIVEAYGIVKHFLSHYTDRRIVIIPPTTLKSFFTGKGNCDKQFVINRVNLVKDHLKTNLTKPLRPVDNDMADAFAIAHVAQEYYKDITELGYKVSLF